MKVTLVNYTREAARMLVLAKSTRLEMNADLFYNIGHMPNDEILEQLDYIADTIPSCWEFVDYTFLVEGVSRAYTHQQVRTRSASYAQQSMRVTRQEGFKYIYTDNNLNDENAKITIQNELRRIQEAYDMLLELGQQPEDARGILPTNISTNIICKFNLRSFSELVKSRTGGRTQNEYQKVVNAMIEEVLMVHPWAEKFLFKKKRDYFKEIEDFAAREFPDIKKRGELLKIVDKMRAE